MGNFHVGQKVVCVDASPVPNCTTPINRGEIYTVRWVELTFFGGDNITCLGLKLEGVKRECFNPAPGEFGNDDIPFAARRFRPVAEKPASMDILRSIVLDPLKPIPDDPREPKHIKTPEEVASTPGGLL